MPHLVLNTLVSIALSLDKISKLSVAEKSQIGASLARQIEPPRADQIEYFREVLEMLESGVLRISWDKYLLVGKHGIVSFCIT